MRWRARGSSSAMTTCNVFVSGMRGRPEGKDHLRDRSSLAARRKSERCRAVVQLREAGARVAEADAGRGGPLHARTVVDHGDDEIITPPVRPDFDYVLA